MEVLLKSGAKPQVEYLKFTSNGRDHRHAEYEYFFVLRGTGEVYVGDQIFQVQPGDMVTIPPNASHWMEPTPGEELEGLLWYHQTPVRTLSEAVQS